MTQSDNPSSRTWIVVPAAGIGTRMGAGMPKQYMSLLGKTILEHTLERLLCLPGLSGMLVAIGTSDTVWQTLPISHDHRVTRVEGGAERSHSVLNALDVLAGQAHPQDWVLVHDAARPCITLQLLQHLRRQLEDDPVGGILAVPVSDTIKRVDSFNTIVQTMNRNELWQAQTPQMFRYGLLRTSLADALAQGHAVTDEASAIEFGGHRHGVVEGRTDNIKVTRPEDLALAQTILQQQENAL